MKLCSYRYEGLDRYGVMTDDGIVDLSARIGDRHPTLVRLLRDQAIDEASKVSDGLSPDYGLGEVEFLPLTSETVQIICVGLNYKDHLAETGKAPAEFPGAFTKIRQSFVGHNQPIVRPRASHQYDFEGEYTIVIGKPARHVSVEDALAYVAGYTILNDGSIRDYQIGRDVFQGKNFWHTSSIGPCMTTRDAAPAWEETVIETRLNGDVMQHSTIDQLIFSVPYLVSYFSQQTALQPGDMISTGTPGGVGHRRTPPVYMKQGDVLEIEISGIGILRNPVIDEAL
jgi:2-keto-4-pentenoate hydratase/2-oxohepta-3-ene-1,7-dioic acid hydratase in catechol pathway